MRLNYDGPLTVELSAYLAHLQYFHWRSPRDDQNLVDDIVRATKGPLVPQEQAHLEPAGGAVPLDSKYYVVRPTDDAFLSAVSRRDPTVLIKGARQMGKTSLLARGLQLARKRGVKTAFLDFQKLGSKQMADQRAFYLALAESLADQLSLDIYPEEKMDPRRSPNVSFDRFLRQEILEPLSQPLIWGLDEVDRLFSCDFGSEVFALFRTWYNERALDPAGPWLHFTLAITYATEAHLFISDLNQSPFNVGTRIMLDDFSIDQLGDLNRLYESPLGDATELQAFYELTHGQPFLARRGLNEIVRGRLSLEEFQATSDQEHGPYGDHLRRLLILLAQDKSMCKVVRDMIQEGASSDPSYFYRLRSAGIIKGESAAEARLRCKVYESFLRRHLD